LVKQYDEKSCTLGGQIKKGSAKPMRRKSDIELEMEGKGEYKKGLNFLACLWEVRVAQEGRNRGGRRDQWSWGGYLG